jgi:hypothetical protein
VKLLIPDPFSPQSYDILKILSLQFKKISVLIPKNPWYSFLFCPTALSNRVAQYYRFSLPPEINALSLALRTQKVKPLARKYAEKVLDICRREQISLIYPSSDDFVLFFSLFKKLFERENIEVAVGDFSLLCELMDKLRSIELASQAGLAVPLTCLASEVNWQKFPALIKPRFGCAGEGQYLILSPKSLDIWRKNNRNLGDFVLQEFIPGNRIIYLRFYMDIQGRICAVSCAENQRPLLKLHQTRALLLHSIPLPKSIIARAKTMLSRLGYSGYCHIQLKVDQSSQIEKVIEVNTRISRGTWSEYSLAFNPVQLSRKLISGDFKGKESFRRGDKIGTLYLWPLQDFMVLVFLFFQWLLKLIESLLGIKAAGVNLPSPRSMARHYRETYLSLKPKRLDNYSRCLWFDPFPALFYGIFFFINNFFKSNQNQ